MASELSGQQQFFIHLTTTHSTDLFCKLSRNGYRINGSSHKLWKM